MASVNEQPASNRYGFWEHAAEVGFYLLLYSLPLGSFAVVIWGDSFLPGGWGHMLARLGIALAIVIAGLALSIFHPFLPRRR